MSEAEQIVMCHDTRPATFGDLLAESDPSRPTPPEMRAAIDEYLSVFAAPVTDDQDRQCCPSCGVHFGGLLANLGSGVGVEWGMIHGEGGCSGCGYPYRGIHYVRDEKGEEICTLRNVFLAYLPENLTRREK